MSTPTIPAARPTAPARGRGEGRAKSKLHQYGSWWWALPAFAAILLVHYVATGLGAMYAFTDWTGLGDFSWIGLENFRTILGNQNNLGALWNTLVLAVGYLVIGNALGLGFALALNRTLKSRYLLRTLLFAPVVLSPLAVSYVFKFIFEVNGPLNTILGGVGLDGWQRTWLADPTWSLWTILVVMVWQNTGLTMVIYLAGLATVPVEIEEAAAIDGAGVASRFRHIVLPLIQPSVAIATTLMLISGLRVFDQVMAMTGGGPMGATDTLATVIYRETFANARYGYGAALSLVLTAIVLVAALLQLYVTRNRTEA